MRQTAFPEAQRQAATPRNSHRVGHGLGQVSKQFSHLSRRAQVLLGRVLTPARGVCQLRAILDADARLMRFKVAGGQKAHIIGGHHRHITVCRQLRDRADIGRLATATDALQLKVIAVTEQRLPSQHLTARFNGAATHQAARHITVHGTG